MSLTVGLFAPLNDVAVATGTGRYTSNLLPALVDLPASTDEELPDIEYVVFAQSGFTDWLDPEVRDQVAVVTLEKRNRRPLDTQHNLDMVHFLVPVYIPTDLPTVFNPFDLRHHEYPEHIDRQELDRRERFHPEGCRRATVIDTFSTAIKEGVVEHYDVDPETVQPVPLGPTLTAEDPTDNPVADGPSGLRAQYDLPDSFVLFPANIWPHKNHERLVEALEYVAETYGERVPLVCTGIRDTPTVPEEYRIEEVPPGEAVYDLGFVDEDRLRALYRECRALVYPTLYEGGGLPVIEAWQFDAPVVCSDIPPLRENGGDAAAYFDPTDVSAIGDTIHEVWTNASLREELVERGRARRERFTWQRSARIYHALYRKAAGEELSVADKEALQYPE
jgi:glycosyltransferase involved in cell wall biosynthesis